MNGPNKYRILLVDDDEDITTVIKRGLEQQGFVIDTFIDPIAARDHFEPGKYDLILLDIRMPKMSGFDLYRELLKRDEKIKVCFITAFEIYYDEFKRLFPTIKVTCFIRKPVTIEKLAEIIRQELVALEAKQKV